MNNSDVNDAVRYLSRSLERELYLDKDYTHNYKLRIFLGKIGINSAKLLRYEFFNFTNSVQSQYIASGGAPSIVQIQSTACATDE